MITEEIVQKINSGDINLRNKMLEKYGYIISQTYRKLQRSGDKSTIMYGATLGLIHALRTFDAKKCVFVNYAYQCAYRTAQTHMSNDWIVRIPKKKLNKILSSGELPYTLIRLAQFENSDENMYDVVPQELMYSEEAKDPEILKVIKNALNDLTPLEKDTIIYKYANTGETLKSVGDKHGVTKEWVRLISNRILEKFKKIVLLKLKEKNEA